MAISDRITAITNHLTDDWNSIDRLGLHTNILPKEYTQVDYIQSSGTQYIDTGYKPNANSEYELNFKIIDYTGTTTGFIFGGRISSSEQNTSFTANRSVNEYSYLGRGNSFAEITNNELQLNTEYLFQIKNNAFIVNGTTKDTTQNTLTGTSTNNLYIFNINNNGSLSTGAKIKLKYFKTYENGQVVHYYIPCFRNTDNEVGLYDLVNNVFYTNQGTGTFTYGQLQEQHIDKNIENIKEPLDLFYNEVSDKTDISQNGVVGRTSQESTTGKNLLNTFNIVTGTRNGLTTSYDSETQEITINGTCNADNTQIIVSTDTIPFTSGTTKIVGYYVSGSITNNGLFRTFSASYQNYEGIDLTTLSSSNPTATKNSTFTGNKVRFDFRFDNGAVANNFKIKLMITDSNDTTFEKFTYGPSPNPDYPQPINNLSGNVSYKVSGKNLLDENYYNNSSLYAISGLYYAFVELPDTFKTKFYVNMSVKGTNQNLVFGFIDTMSGVFTGGIRVLNNGTLNSNVECDFTNAEHVYIGIGNGSTINKNTDIARIFDNYNIMVSTTSGEQYEPYIEPQTFTIPLGDIELAEIDTYEDKIYSSDGRFYLEKKNGKVILNGSEDWIYTSGLGNIYSTIQQNFDYSGNNKYYANYFLYSSNDNKITLGTSGSSKVMYMKLLNSITDVASSDTTSTIVEKIKSWLSTHNTIVYYPLVTPTTTEITQENYPSLYNALKQIQDYLTAYKINKEFILGYSSPEIEY